MSDNINTITNPTDIQIITSDRQQKKQYIRREKIVELIEVDGKKVSKTSTGKRKFHNKSKNGCLNCKRRRVKCDEGKPICTKCVHVKLDCVYKPITADDENSSVLISRPGSAASSSNGNVLDGDVRIETASAANSGIITNNTSASIAGSAGSDNNNNKPSPEKRVTITKYMHRRPDGTLEPDTTIMNNPAVINSSSKENDKINKTRKLTKKRSETSLNKMNGINRSLPNKKKNKKANTAKGSPVKVEPVNKLNSLGPLSGLASLLSKNGLSGADPEQLMAAAATQFPGIMASMMSPGGNMPNIGMIPSLVASTLGQNGSVNGLQHLAGLINNATPTNNNNTAPDSNNLPNHHIPQNGTGNATNNVTTSQYDINNGIPFSPGMGLSGLISRHDTNIQPPSHATSSLSDNLLNTHNNSNNPSNTTSTIHPPIVNNGLNFMGQSSLSTVANDMSNNYNSMVSPKAFAAGPSHAQQQLQYQLHQQLQLQQHQQLQLQHDQQLQSQHQQLQLQQRQLLQQLLNQDQTQLQQMQAQAQAQEISQPLAAMIDQSIIPAQIQQQLQQSPSANNNNNDIPLPLQEESLSQLSKMGLNLKTLGNLPTAGIGGIAYDFQELLGLKFNAGKNSNGQTTPGATTNVSSMVSPSIAAVAAAAVATTHSSKASTAEAILADMQEQERVKKESMDQDGTEDKEKSISTASDLNHLVSQQNISHNGPLPMISQLSPLIKTNIDGALTAHSSPSVGLLSRDIANQTEHHQKNKSIDSMTGSIHHKSDTMEKKQQEPLTGVAKLLQLSTKANLNLVDMKLFHHYCTEVCSSITTMSVPEVWSKDVPELAFNYPFLMHSLLAFSATHLSRTEPSLEQYVSSHRLDALRLLREAVLEISEENTDALVASALILIMDSLANASTAPAGSQNTMASSAWIFHVKGAATILTAVWPLSENSRFHDLISVDLSDLGDVINKEDGTISELVCFDESIADLYPVDIDSPYLITLAYLDKLNREIDDSDFILRIFSFPALLDKTFLALLMTGDLNAMRIMRSYYKLLRGFTTKLKDKVWFLEGLSQVLPQDVDEYSGGGGMHMMLDFLGGGLPSMTTTNLSDFI